MLLIKKISNDIKASLADAEKYIGRAMSFVTENPSLANVYYDIFNDHKKEVMALHTQVVNIIKSTGKQDIDSKVLDVMEKLWEWEHMELMERMELLDKREQRYMALKSNR